MQDSVVEKVVAFRFQSCPEPLVVLGEGDEIFGPGVIGGHSLSSAHVSAV